MYTKMEEQIIGEGLLEKKKKAIAVSLASFAENYRKETTPELNQIWIESLNHLSLVQIAQGTRLCLQEIQYFPTVANFLELATLRSKESDRWKDIEPDPNQEQIEHNRKPIPMPEEYKKQWRKFLDKSTVK